MFSLTTSSPQSKIHRNRYLIHERFFPFRYLFSLIDSISISRRGPSTAWIVLRIPPTIRAVRPTTRWDWACEASRHLASNVSKDKKFCSAAPHFFSDSKFCAVWASERAFLCAINLNFKFLSSSPTNSPPPLADPPENVTITPQEVQVVEGGKPPRLLCSASAHPSKFHYPIARIIL